MIAPSSRSRYLVFSFLYLLVSYMLHWWLQLQYYKHCRSNVLRVLLFKRSDMCVILSGVINTIEGNYATLLHYGMGQMA
jgi:hypothetical protein